MRLHGTADVPPPASAIDDSKAARYHYDIQKACRESRGMMTTNDITFYLNNLVITEEQAKKLELTGAAHVVAGASGGLPKCGNIAGVVGHDVNTPWMMLMEGPGNHWLETLEGRCTHCGCNARAHLRKPWHLHGPERDCYVCCRDCANEGGCHVTPPHGSVDAALGLR